MALTLADADSMIEAAQRNGVYLVVGHSHSYETPIQRIKEIVGSGELGELRMINNWYFTSWLYNLRNREELDTSLGGGVTFRQGSHQFDIIRIIGGGVIRSVRAMTGVWDDSRPTQGSHVVYLEFETEHRPPLCIAAMTGFTPLKSPTESVSRVNPQTFQSTPGPGKG